MMLLFKNWIFFFLYLFFHLKVNNYNISWRMDNILYEIGLSFESYSTKRKRKFNSKTILVISNTILFMTFSTISIFNEEFEVALMLGDLSSFVRLKFYGNLAKILCCLLIFSSMWIYYYNYRKNVEQTFIVLFRGLSGDIDPSLIGVSRFDDFNKLKVQAHKIFSFLNYQNKYFMPSVTFLIVIFLYGMVSDPTSMTIYGLPHAAHWAIFAKTNFEIITYQIFYFYFICKYLILKIKDLNGVLSRMAKEFISQRKISKILHSYDALYREIHDYNSTYWSKFLLLFWICFGTYVVLILIVVLQQNSHTLVLIVCLYLLLVYSSIFLLVIFTAASVNKEVHKVYPKFFNLFIILNKNFSGAKNLKNFLKVIS